MKLKSFTVKMVSLCLLINSCSTDEELNEEVKIEKSTHQQHLKVNSQNNSLYETLMRWGYKDSQIEDLGRFYRVDGDIIMDKSKDYSIDPTKSRIDENVVTLKNIKIWINPAMNTNWINASIQAINRWNLQLNEINLTRITNRNDADIEILYHTQESNPIFYEINDRGFAALPLASNTFGSVFDFPTNDGIPGNKVWINQNFESSRFCGSGITQNMQIANVQHEIGHNLGFHHSNSNFGIHIEGTPINDPNSVMNGGQACTISDFSQGDISGIQSIYGSSFESSVWKDGYGYNNTWRKTKHERKIADINGDGKADIVGFHDGLVYTALSNGNGFDSSKTHSIGFVYNSTWRVEKHVRELADVNGDGKADIIGFHDGQVYVALSNGDGFNSASIWKDGYGYNNTWRKTKHERKMADINGDGKADIVGFHDGLVYTALSNGNGFDSSKTHSIGFVYNSTWRIEKHVRELADVNGDGKADIIGFHDEQVYVAPSML